MRRFLTIRWGTPIRTTITTGAVTTPRTHWARRGHRTSSRTTDPAFMGPGLTAPTDLSTSCQPLTLPTFTDISGADVTIIAASVGGESDTIASRDAPWSV